MKILRLREGLRITLQSVDDGITRLSFGCFCVIAFAGTSRGRRLLQCFTLWYLLPSRVRRLISSNVTYYKSGRGECLKAARRAKVCGTVYVRL